MRRLVKGLEYRIEDTEILSLHPYIDVNQTDSVLNLRKFLDFTT